MFCWDALTGPLVQRNAGLCSLRLRPLHDSLTCMLQMMKLTFSPCGGVGWGGDLTFSEAVFIRINITFYIVNMDNMTRVWT